MNSRIVAAFVSRILSMINLPRESVTATEIVAWWTSMPTYFSWLITALLSVSGDANNHNLPQSGRLLYCVTRPVPVNREREMAADGWAVAKSASQIRLAPVTRPLHGPGRGCLYGDLSRYTGDCRLPGYCPVVWP